MYFVLFWQSRSAWLSCSRVLLAFLQLQITKLNTASYIGCLKSLNNRRKYKRKIFLLVLPSLYHLEFKSLLQIPMRSLLLVPTYWQPILYKSVLRIVYAEPVFSLVEGKGEARVSMSWFMPRQKILSGGFEPHDNSFLGADSKITTFIPCSSHFTAYRVSGSKNSSLVWVVALAVLYRS